LVVGYTVATVAVTAFLALLVGLQVLASMRDPHHALGLAAGFAIGCIVVSRQR
jgi:hypothetical protein